MATHGPESVTAPDDNHVINSKDPVYEEQDSGIMDQDQMDDPDFGAMGGYEAEIPDGMGGYEASDNSMVGYGFEPPPTLDPFAKDTSNSIYDRPALDCPYDAPIPEPVSTPIDDYSDNLANLDTENDDCKRADIDESEPVTPEPVENEESSSDDEAPPPPPTVDYDDGATSDGSRQLSEAELLEATKAAELLKEAMGIDVTGKTKKKKKGKKTSKSKDGLVMKPKRKTSRNSPETTISDENIQPFTLPVDPTAKEINDIDAETDFGNAVAADLNSPNDALLFRKPSLTKIEDVLGNSGRIKYTSVCCSESYLAFGCNTGGVYVFTREKCRFLQVLPGKDGDVTALAFGQDEFLLAAGSCNGTVNIWKGPWGSSDSTATLLKVVVEHSESPITSIAWSFDTKRMYSGDGRGLVLSTPVTKKPLVPSTTRILPNYKFIHRAVAMAIPDSDVVYRCKSPIVQLDVSISGSLVISSTKQTIIADPTVRQVWVIGQKKPRDGAFGACFGPGTKFPSVYCARPSSRIWVAKSRTGAVSATYNLKEQFDRESSPILSAAGQVGGVLPSIGSRSMSFSKLRVVRENYLVAWTSDTIVVIDSAKARLLGYYTDLSGIVDVAVVNEEIYVLHTKTVESDGGEEGSSGASPSTQFLCDHLVLLSPGECATAMATTGNIADACEMVLEYHENATQEKFLENVQQSDLTVLRHLISGPKDLTPPSPSNPKHQEAEAREADLEKRLTKIALESAQIRMEKENETVQSAENAFMQRIQNTGQELVLDVASDETSDSDNSSTTPVVNLSPSRKFIKNMFST
eukprot:m.114802 g.114802  ORF g.114802 m.114802 type:complete len:805 (+) comp28373_c0_seq1:344-2758(+)